MSTQYRQPDMTTLWKRTQSLRTRAATVITLPPMQLSAIRQMRVLLPRLLWPDVLSTSARVLKGSLTHDNQQTGSQRNNRHKRHQAREAEVYQLNEPGENQPNTEEERSETLYLHVVDSLAD